MQITPTKYKLLSLASGKQFDDTGWMLEAPNEKATGLIRTIYAKKQIDVKPMDYGLYRFADWLPVQKALKGSFAPITYKSEGLAKKLGLENLYITFSGYWPEKGIEMPTCSFKETESYSVCGRKDDHDGKVLVVASAGNTARAFARVCSDNNIPLLLCVPEDNLNALWFDRPINGNVKLVASKSGGDYFDAIHLSNLAVQMDMFVAEGGAKNVARRDGMGTTTLSAADFIGEIPEYYFQAVGSGTGAVAAWEANLRLIEDGRFGNRKMKLMVTLVDKPGSLMKLTELLQELNANIVHIAYDRTSTSLDYGDANVTIHLETKGKKHQDEIRSVLHEHGYLSAEMN